MCVRLAPRLTGKVSSAWRQCLMLGLLMVAIGSLGGCITHPQPPHTRVESNPFDGLRYVWVSPGIFQMGCSPGDMQCSKNESPVHAVTLTQGFWISETPVTQAAYRRISEDSPSFEHGPNFPVEKVSWDAADRYCRSMNMHLPTEAQWEYAARAGASADRYGPLDEIAWYGTTRAHPVGRKTPNAFGLYDMLGNVYEWTADWDGPYSAAAQTDPSGPTDGQYKILRGGSFLEPASSVRASARYYSETAEELLDFGFRCVASGADLNADVLPKRQDQITAAYSDTLNLANIPKQPVYGSVPDGNHSAFLLLSKGTEPKRYYVVFAARGSDTSPHPLTNGLDLRHPEEFPGHAFVVWATEDPAAAKSTIVKAYGLYPADQTGQYAYGFIPQSFVTAVFGGPGQVEDENDEPSLHSIGLITNDLIIEVNQEQFDQTLSLAQSTAASKATYQLLAKDCVAFMASIASNLLGADVLPSRALNPFPQLYVANLAANVTAVRNIPVPGGTWNGPAWHGKIANGDGVLTLANGGRFSGRVVMGVPRQGTLIFANGGSFQGTLDHGSPQGAGSFVMADGARLDATFQHGNPTQGTLHCADGTVITGSMSNHTFNGQVDLKLASGDAYNGTWAGGPQGKGTYRLKDGTVVDGNWDHRQLSGHGTMTQPSGARYDGNWKDGRPDGNGMLTMSDGTKYVGDWKDGRPDGNGTLTMSVGIKYVGQWTNGKPNGNGTITSHTGTRASGRWRDGALDFDHARYVDPDGKVTNAKGDTIGDSGDVGKGVGDDAEDIKGEYNGGHTDEPQVRDGPLL